MYCPFCGKKLEHLSPLYFHTGKTWFGCAPCNSVLERNHCSVTGRVKNIEPCIHSYKNYQLALKRKKKGEENGQNESDRR